MSKIKSEHTGAENGGGYWGTREEAKRLSKKTRRGEDQAVVRTVPRKPVDQPSLLLNAWAEKENRDGS